MIDSWPLAIGPASRNQAALLNAFQALAHATAFTFRGPFIIAVSFDVLGESFFFTHFLEAAQHLLDTFTASGLDLDHATYLNSM